ncbi:MAG: SH3 domain-containing protein [Faecousia sp.]
MATFNGKVVGGSLKLRASASTSASSPTSIPNGTSISVSTISGNQEWFSTSYGGHSGYVVAQYVAITAGGKACTVTTTSGPLNIRKSASTSATVIFTAAKGSTMRVLEGPDNGWLRVSNASGTGWGSSDFLTIDDNTGGGGGDYTIAAVVDTEKNGVGGTLNMRASASQSSSVVTTIPDGATIYVKSMSGEWLAAKYNSYTGYVMAKHVMDTAYYNDSTGSDTGGGSSTAPTVLDSVRNGKSTIRLNDTGEAVVELRKLLQGKGISVANVTSNIFDQALKNAVISFQNQYSVLGNDGIVGQCTLAVLEDDSNSTGWFVEGQKGSCRLTAGKLVLCGFTGPYVISPDHVDRLNKAINNTSFNFTSKVQIRHFLAQGRKECDSGNTMTEYIYSEGSQASYGGFYGAGFMQLTGSKNYSAFHDWLKSATGYGADSQVTAWRTATKRVANNYPMVSAAWYFSQHNTDKDINNVILEYWNSSVDTTVKKVTALVQGGTGSWEQRKSYYEKIKTVLL